MDGFEIQYGFLSQHWARDKFRVEAKGIHFCLHVVLAAVRACAARDSAICSNDSKIHTRGFILSIEMLSGFLYGLRLRLRCLLSVDCEGKVFLILMSTDLPCGAN